MSPKTMVSPFWYAVGGTCAVPLFCIIMLISSLGIIIMWPFVPVLLFLKRRQEIAMVFGRPPHE